MLARFLLVMILKLLSVFQLLYSDEKNGKVDIVQNS
jgi:hypothetical protein